MTPSTGSAGSGTTTTSTLRSWIGGTKGVLQKAHRRLKKAVQLPQKNSILNDNAGVLSLPRPEDTGPWPRKISLGHSVSESQVCLFFSSQSAGYLGPRNPTLHSQIHLLTPGGRYDGTRSLRTSQKVIQQQPSQMAQLVDQLRHEEILSMYPCCLGCCLLFVVTRVGGRKKEQS